MPEGTVIFYDKRVGKQFGFVEIAEGEQIYFHFKDGRELEIVDHKIGFSKGEIKNEPKMGDRIVFEITHNCEGPKASQWAYVGEHESAMKDIASTPMYRVVKKKTTTADNQPGEPEILWKGSNIAQLMRKHPRPRDCRADSLNPQSGHIDFSTRIYFERKIGNGDWEHAEDPRLICPSK